MQITIRPDASHPNAKVVRVELDLLDGHKLTSKAMTLVEARQLRAELERRIFEIGEGVRSGHCDHM